VVVGKVKEKAYHWKGSSYSKCWTEKGTLMEGHHTTISIFAKFLFGEEKMFKSI